jgi:phosphatidylserine decarboxylase
MKQTIVRVLQNENLNFLLTNRIPRIAATHFLGWLSHIESPRLATLLIWVWRRFTDLDLSESKKQQFRSLNECFTRELEDGARPFCDDPASIASPSDGIVGAHGDIDNGTLIQAKGFGYSLHELTLSPELADEFHNGYFITLRLTSSMYHRFHAPADLSVSKVTYISGDTWNVNPIALKRVEKLFCKNERAVIEATLKPSRKRIAMVPVAAVLVASIRLHFINVLLHLRYKGANPISVDAHLHRGQEMGWFEHGSTIILLFPSGYQLAPTLGLGSIVKAGQALLKATEASQ